IPAMLNFSSGCQNVLKACETAKIRMVYTSRQFIERAGLEETALELEKHVTLIYLEDIRDK
ncbi:MAG: hypothetical protein GTO60_04795, partial [Gammaproteobacteria bacterium]|nr:hypothetical protein [Gammaproteobacteria bacterium]NIO62186.1 hypothetical protein [Gammaproteobacteria bacterium]